MMEKRTVKYILTQATMQFAVKETQEADIPAFVLDMTHTDKHNQVSEHSVAISPSKLQGLCAMLQRMLHRHGYTVPEPPRTVITKH